MLVPIISSISAGVLAKFVSEYEDWKTRRREYFWNCVKNNPPSRCYIEVVQKYPIPNKRVIYVILTALTFATFLWFMKEFINETKEERR
jgi:hypothetical protein